MQIVAFNLCQKPVGGEGVRRPEPVRRQGTPPYPLKFNSRLYFTTNCRCFGPAKIPVRSSDPV